jgi:hypothetical protein
MRDRKEQNINLTLPERKDSGGMFEESSEDPDLGAATRIELSDLGEQIAKLRPAFELASEETKRAAEEVEKTWCTQQKQFQQQVKKMPQLQNELKREQEQMKIEMQKLQREMRGVGLDI